MAGATTTGSVRGFLGTLLLLLVFVGAGTAEAERVPGTPATPPAPRSSATPVTTSSPPPAKAPVAPPPLSPSTTTPAADNEFDSQVRLLEERVHEAKEQVFRARARLHLLGQKAAGEDLLSGAKTVIIHHNEMSSTFVLESLTYRLDGATIFDRVDRDGDLSKLEEFEVFGGRLLPGPHAVTVMATYRGGRPGGLFSYLEDYRFRSTSTHEFTVDGGKATTLKVVGFEKGGITSKLEERPAMRFEVTVAREGSSGGTDAAR